MSRTQEFTDKLELLKAARIESETARREAYLKSQAHLKIARNEQQKTRGLGAEEIAALSKEKVLAGQAAGRAWSGFSQKWTAELSQLVDLAQDLDPRRNIGQMDDSFPILLMPLRLETRFAPGADELWLRVYPDAWAVDGFEESLTETEIENGKAFWTGYRAAAGKKELQLAAWRNLVANHGTARARWIVTSYRPANEQDAPEPGSAGEKFLILEDAMPAQPEADAIAAYWTSLWRKPGDVTFASSALDALKSALGEAAAETAAALPPRNLVDSGDPADRTSAVVSLIWIEWPDLDEEEVKAAGWSQAARTDALPERLVVTLQSGNTSRSVIGRVIPSSVTLGFDPSAPDAEQIKQENGELTLPDAMAWIFDFDKAVNIGLGFRIPLSREERTEGFDRVIVCGVSLRDDEEESQEMLERLFEHHYFSGNGIALVPQGTPTNNSETTSGYSEKDDVGNSFDRLFGELPDLAQSGRLDKLDGQWLAQWLGIEAAKLAGIPFVEGRDQLEARAMNRLLWPATIGYSLDTLMADILTEEAVEDTRLFFEDYTLARDCVPQIRIGDQPYGILPASAWSKHNWFEQQVAGDANNQSLAARRQAAAFLQSRFGRAAFVPKLYEIIAKAGLQWSELVPLTAHVDHGTDLHQALLDVLGLAPNSLEFYRRNADKFEHVFNLLRAQGHGGLFQAAYLWAGTQAAMAMLADMGWQGQDTPEILEFIFHQGQEALQHILVDDVEPSESNPVRAYSDTGDNYLHWLIQAGETSLEALRQQAGFTDDEVPSALLYHLARHALQLSYWDVGLKMHKALPDPVLTLTELAAARKEPALMHIAQSDQQSSSRYFHLYRPAAAITGSQTALLQDHIAAVWNSANEAAAYRRVLDGLRNLADTPTARLERLLIEHLDLCTYRQDAWRQGMLQLQLEFMRHHLTPVVRRDRPPRDPNSNSPASARQGIYLGAYGWVEDLRPTSQQPQPANVPADVAEAFDATSRPMVEDPSNLGYIHAPSLDQAQTAAVLRSTYENNSSEDNPGTMAVNLSSWRVRQATNVLEGLRNDQSLGEILGYRFERELHENFELAETDEYIFALRKHFPLVANKIKETYQDLPPGVTIETIEARNVVDGEALLEYIEKTGTTSYPFGLSDMPDAPGAKGVKINAAVEHLKNVADAVADLAIAESVHQALKGKPETAAANLDAQGSGLFPPVSEFITTPREGTTITSRTVVFLDAASPAGPVWASIAQTPRGAAEPVLNHWLGSLFPAADKIGLKVLNVADNTRTDLTLEQLGWQPIDWIFDLDLESELARSALGLRIERLHRTAQAPVDPEAEIRPLYDEAPAGTISLFDFASLVSSVRRLITRSRALKASDIALNNDSKASRQGGAPVLPRQRVVDALTTLETLKADVSTFLAGLSSDLDDVDANAASIRSELATQLTDFEALAARGAAFGMIELDASLGMRWRRQWIKPIRERLKKEIADWEKRLADFHGYIARADAVPPGAPFSDVFRPLQRAERQVTTSVTSPMPDDPATMRADLAVKAQQFEARLDAMRAVAASSTDDADAFLASVEATQPITQFVPEDFDLAEARAGFARSTAEMAAGLVAQVTAIDARIGKTNAKLAVHDAATEQEKAVAALEEALQALFGEDFVAVPAFRFGESQQGELALCHADRDLLIRHQRDDLGDIAPLDTWLGGVARIRDQMAEFEHIVMAAEALTGSRRTLDPWQLPHVPDDHWLGAAYPEDHEIVGDRLLVQAHHAKAFDSTATQIGLLIDEWTEVIPTKDITTGVAFHFDQPGSEPPQAFLLMTPPTFRGAWEWDDIIDGIIETFDAAKARAVEPDHIDRTPYALFLPATLATTTHHPLTIALNYAVMNNFSRVK